MPSNPLLHFITKVNNLEDIKVINYDFITDDEIVIEVENKLKGGKNYAAVLVDLETRKPITLLEKRNKAVIAQYLSSLVSEVLNQIEEVSIDLWIPYKSLIQEMLPNAQVVSQCCGMVSLRRRLRTRRVADRFHVMKQINQELDERRKQEKWAAVKIKNRQEREEKLAGLTHSKYPLLKKKQSLNDEEKAKINSLQKLAPKLGEMY
jgi:transposase